MQHFNGLTPAEAERLALLAEEMGEALQVVGKILRHGYESRNPLEKDGITNREALQRELGDVTHAVLRLCDCGDVSTDVINSQAIRKASSIGRWLHHQDDAPQHL